MHRIRLAAMLFGALAAGTAAVAQKPQPFPRPGEAERPQPAPAPPPATGAAAAPQTPPPATAEAVPNEQMLGMPVYPGAQYLTSYDAGRGQRFYLFGTNVGFADIVGYYRTVLRQRGNFVYEQPPIHVFEVGRYRSDSVAFPPGITVKDYTWGGSPGYLNPVPGADPSHFATIIQVVPPPPGAGTGR